MSAPKLEGWSSISGATKMHYFRGGRSLCGRWAYLGKTFEAPDLTRTINCAACDRFRVLERQKLKVAP